eukprot:jgi/Undpi1/12061/HiC_scaffold_4.g01759.m1
MCVSAYYISRGHALYFNGNVSSAHADYRRALELDPGNAEARRLCLQFDTREGNLAGKPSEHKNNLWATTTTTSETATTTTRKRNIGNRGNGSHSAGAIPPTTTLNTSTTLPQDHQHPTQLDGISATERCKLIAVSAPSQSPSPPAERSIQALRQSPAHHVLSKSNRSTTAAVACTTRTAASCRCNTCGAVGVGGGRGGSAQSSAKGRLAGSGRVSMSGDGGTGRDRSGKWRRRPRQMLSKGILPAIDTRPPKEPEWGKAVSSAKASHDHLRQMRAARVGGVLARDERLWGMLQAPRKGWGAATRSSPDSRSHAAPPTLVAGLSPSVEGGAGSESTSRNNLRRDLERPSKPPIVAIGVVGSTRKEKTGDAQVPPLPSASSFDAKGPAKCC